jgi:hypothetical protein
MGPARPTGSIHASAGSRGSWKGFGATQLDPSFRVATFVFRGGPFTFARKPEVETKRKGIRWPCCRRAPKPSTSRRVTRRVGWIRCQGAKHVMEKRVAPKRNALRENRRSRQNVCNPPAVFLKFCAKARSRRNVIRRPRFGSLSENREPRHESSNRPIVFHKFRAKAGSRHKT